MVIGRAWRPWIAIYRSEASVTSRYYTVLAASRSAQNLVDKVDGANSASTTLDKTDHLFIRVVVCVICAL